MSSTHTIETPATHTEVLKQLGIVDLNPGACSGPGAWSGTDGRDVLESVNPTTGQVIASVGDTGSLRGAVLYFEIWKGTKVMPTRQWLR